MPMPVFADASTAFDVSKPMVHGLMLAAQAQGLASCAIGALASYPQIVRAALGLPESEAVVCGLALGWEDAQASVNRTRTEREPLSRYFSVLR